MIILGIVLVLIALGLVAYVVVGDDGSAPVTLEAFDVGLETTPLVLFLAGAATLLLALLGLWLMRAGAVRSARRRSEIGRLRRVEAEVQSRQLEEQREAEARAHAEQEAAAAVPVAQDPGPPFVRREGVPDAPFDRDQREPVPSTARDTTGEVPHGTLREPVPGSLAAGADDVRADERRPPGGATAYDATRVGEPADARRPDGPADAPRR